MAEKRKSITSLSSVIDAIKSVDLGELRRNSGLGVSMTAFFLVAQLAGAGFLALPNAMADSGWIGFALMFIFCVSVAYASIKLGHSWVIIEERYPEYRNPVRQPYADMAEKSLGKIGRRSALTFIMIANIGSSTAFIILISELINSIYDQLSICEYSVIVAVFLIPFTWLGTPKDFWQASVFAVLATVLAIIIIAVKIFIDFEKGTVYPLPEHPNPTFLSFALAFGAIMFAFGGSSVFPTVQNDMKDRTLFWKGVVLSFTAIFILYLPVTLFGYLYIGDAVESNVILSFDSSPTVTVAVFFEICNLLGTFIITLSPVFQSLEDMLHVPQTFGIKRVCLRSGLILCELLVALAFPDFGLIVNLLGGSAMSFLSFILPPLMYMKLVDDKSNKDWPERSIPLWERIYLWEIVGVGVIGGIAATLSALYELLRPEQFQSSCFVQFVPE